MINHDPSLRVLAKVMITMEMCYKQNDAGVRKVESTHTWVST